MICPICKREMVCMTPLHAKKHNMTMEDFRKKYGNIKTYNTINPAVHVEHKNRHIKPWTGKRI
jgi:hypothetical protein